VRRAWRVSPDAGYQVIAASRTQLSHGAKVLRAGERIDEPLPGGESYLIVADPDTPGAMIDLAMAWAYHGDATLLAVRAPSGPPVFVGLARSLYAVATDKDLSRNGISLVLGASALASCARDRGADANLADAPM
jgi:hypothetical protein